MVMHTFIYAQSVQHVRRDDVHEKYTRGLCLLLGKKICYLHYNQIQHWLKYYQRLDAIPQILLDVYDQSIRLDILSNWL